MATILIAEDERDIRDLIGMTLNFGGHKVVKASNGAEAVEMAPQVMPDLIMMDVRMPRMTGFEACTALKKIDTVKNIPVVFLSAKGQESDFETGIEAGAYDFILKPFSPAELLTRINQILALTLQTAKGTPSPTISTVDIPTPVPIALPKSGLGKNSTTVADNSSKPAASPADPAVDNR